MHTLFFTETVREGGRDCLVGWGLLSLLSTTTGLEECDIHAQLIQYVSLWVVFVFFSTQTFSLFSQSLLFWPGNSFADLHWAVGWLGCMCGNASCVAVGGLVHLVHQCPGWHLDGPMQATGMLDARRGPWSLLACFVLCKLHFCLHDLTEERAVGSAVGTNSAWRSCGAFNMCWKVRPG